MSSRYFFMRYNPKPVPSFNFEVDGARNILWKTNGWSISEIPTPSSDTTISTWSSCGLMPNEIVAPSSEYLQAFDNKFVITDSNFTASASIKICGIEEWNIKFFCGLFSLKISKTPLQNSTASKIESINKFSSVSSRCCSSRVRWIILFNRTALS